MNKLQIGDLVKLISGTFSDSPNNPKWEGKYGKIKGMILHTDNGGDLPITVRWNNGFKNCYYPTHLELLAPVGVKPFLVVI